MGSRVGKREEPPNHAIFSSPGNQMRYYSAQFSNGRAGWADIESGASLKRKESEEVQETFGLKFLVATRTIRKPHGWKPGDSPTFSSPSFRDGGETLSSQVRESRKDKNG